MAAFIRKRLWLIIIAVVYMAAMIATSGPKARKINERSDHWIIWQAGKDFFDHHELYYRTGIRPFTYTPFAAFVFQPLHILPLKASAHILYLLNALVLLPLSIYLIRIILLKSGVKPEKARLALTLAVLFTLKYFWNNQIMFQTNYIIFVFLLAGIYFLVQKKPHLAGMLFTLVAMIKITPVFLAVYTLTFHFSRKVAAYIILTGLICLVLPAASRGGRQLANDYKGYYESFLKEYVVEGRVVADQVNHNLKAGIFKALHPETRGNEDVDIDRYPGTALSLSIIQVLLLMVLILNGFLLYRRKRYFSLAYLASIILYAHLASGITWTAHLVTLMFCLLPVLLMDVKKLPSAMKMVFWFLIAVFVFLGIEGSDTFGRRIYLAIRFYDVYTGLLLLLFLLYSWIVWDERKRSLYPEGILI